MRIPRLLQQAGARLNLIDRLAMRGRAGAMTLTRPADNNHPGSQDPPPSHVHPLVVLSLAVSLSTLTALHSGWADAVTVLVAVLSVFGYPRASA